MSARTFMTSGFLAGWLLLATVAQPFAAENVPEGARWQRDPFRYATPATRGQVRGPSEPKRTTAPAATTGKGLEGIFVKNGVFQALYDGRLVGPGDRVGSVVIREISLYAIVVEGNAGRRTIELFHEN